MTTKQPCGTPAAHRRHARHNEEPCEPCTTAVRNTATQRRRRKGIKLSTYNTTPTPQLIEDIRFLLNAGEGEQRILQATGYTNQPRTLRSRLNKAGRRDLVDRIFTTWDLAA